MLIQVNKLLQSRFKTLFPLSCNNYSLPSKNSLKVSTLCPKCCINYSGILIHYGTHPEQQSVAVMSICEVRWFIR